MADLMDKIVSLAKRRGFVYPGSEIYGGLANSWDYGPLGVELKNNIKQEWWKRFVHGRDDIVGLDAALLMNPKVWEASGHLKNFQDPLVECKNCHERFRADDIDLKKSCPNCETIGTFTAPSQFNLMLKTFLGPAEDKANIVYFRPETAQAMFVNFKNVIQTTPAKLPFGIAQTGKAFRNEITPGNFIFRTREFEQMEIEYFVPPPKKDAEWQKHFDYWLQEMKSWLKHLGVSEKHLHYVDIPDGERAHYSKRTVDIEYDYPFGQKELYGLAYRGDFDLKNHATASGEDLTYADPDTGEKFLPHVIEPTWGVDRTVLVALLEAYDDTQKDRIVLRLKPWLAPYKVAVFPLLANKPELIKKARDIYKLLTTSYSLTPIAWDDRGNIGKRYYSQDEIGTPYCVTVDFDTLEDNTVTVRDRDTMKQERIVATDLPSYLKEKLTA
ncbi:MAG: Glycine-tRNA ligase [Parcubacteria group bacterium GW2011_GWA2_46_9]|nr:MAG: Glycine-tRNA ligase [Parcubacteria group bacterium GW2011_GWA2_46_9]